MSKSKFLERMLQPDEPLRAAPTPQIAKSKSISSTIERIGPGSSREPAPEPYG
jgi:hypothetical protein